MAHGTRRTCKRMYAAATSTEFHAEERHGTRLHARLLQRVLHHRVDVGCVRGLRQVGHDAAPVLVHVLLGRNRFAEDATAAGHDCHACVIAAALDAEHDVLCIGVRDVRWAVGSSCTGCGHRTVSLQCWHEGAGAAGVCRVQILGCRRPSCGTSSGAS